MGQDQDWRITAGLSLQGQHFSNHRLASLENSAALDAHGAGKQPHEQLKLCFLTSADEHRGF